MLKRVEKQRESMIKIRGGYSDTSGVAPFSAPMQIEEFDDRTRVILSNTLFDLLQKTFEEDVVFYMDYCGGNIENVFCKEILSEVFAERTNLRAGYSFAWRAVFENNIHPVIENALYNEVLDILWFICEWIRKNNICFPGKQYDLFNEIFEKESVGYRFVSGKIVKITDEAEIGEIEEAANSKFEGCRTHINNAVTILADREHKDYKNCIKESISAVESICKIIINNDSATLGEALRVLEKKRGLKGQLKSAFEKLYNYTNGKGGIRHADGLFVSEVTFEEAKFMLVSCSAFVNYLIAEYGKIDQEDKNFIE